MESHLLQMRGLKRIALGLKTPMRTVASFTDAWIETHQSGNDIDLGTSHLLQMRGLKPRKSLCARF